MRQTRMETCAAIWEEAAKIQNVMSLIKRPRQKDRKRGTKIRG
jgi:hypothetical protein